MKRPRSPADKSIKLVSWNVTSLRSSVKKGMLDFIENENPDLLLVQETKLNEAECTLIPKSTFPYQHFHCCQTRKGYSGSAVFSKIKPLRVIDGFVHTDCGITDDEGRIISLELDKFFLVATYVPNAGQGLPRLDWKTSVWNVELEKHLLELEKEKPVVWAGDMNVCRQDIDLARPKENRNKTAGFTDQERNSFENMLKNRTDIWRFLHPEKQAFTYFSKRFNCREKNIGWRLDYFVLSSELIENVKSCEIRDDIYGPSDHVPVVLDIKIAE